MKSKRGRTRGVGRPVAQDADVRAALMSAAKELFLTHGFARVTARQIAAAANTTPAMIHYYFDNKVGLFRAMLQEAIEPFGRMLGDVSGASDADLPDLSALIEGHLRTAAANTWIASLIVNEVLPEDGQFRDAFVRDIASRLLPQLVELLDRGRRAGQFREDIDPRLTALSIISLNIFPLISRPITAPLLGFGLSGAALDALVEHTKCLVLRGIGRTPEAHK